MPLVYFSYDGSSRLGKLFGDHVVDLSVAAPELPDTVIAFLEGGEPALATFRAVDDQAAGTLALADIELLPPVPNP